MSSILKYAALMLIAVILITAVVLYFDYHKSSDPSRNTAKKSGTIEDTSDQYNVSFSFDGDKSQMIDLIKGNAELDIVYSGSSDFEAKLFFKDGTLLADLADQYGPFTEKQTVLIPETGAYLLDIKTKGEWSLNKD